MDGGDPQDPFRVPAGRDDEEEQGGARALLREDLPPVMDTGSSLGRVEEGPSPLPRGVGAGDPAACGPVGGVGGGGRAAASLLPLQVAARGSPTWPPSCCRCNLLRRARVVGVAGKPRGGGG